MVAACRLAQARRTGDQAGVTAAARQLLTLVPPDRVADGGSPDHVSPTDAGARVLARTALGSAALARGDLTTAEAELADGLDQTHRAGLARLIPACASRLALAYALRGGLGAAERVVRTALAAPSCGDSRHADDGHAYLALALVSAHRGRPDDAEANLSLAAGVSSPATPERGPEADPIGESPEEPVLAALIALTRAQLRHDRGDLAGSYQALRAGRWAVDRSGSRWLAQEFIAAEARLSVTRGDPERARELLCPVLDTEARPVASLAVVLADAELRAGDPRSAARALPRWDGVPGESWPLPVRLEAGLLEAVTARLLGDQRRATRTLERVLQLAEPDGYRWVFARAHPVVRDLLSAHLDSGTAYWPLVTELVATVDGAQPGPSDGAGVVEPLTERELTVLRYLQSILSNVEIASELSLSVNTVKTHVRNIYRKLDATRRRDAVRRARELRLL
jgi:LuxR family maltose regulon positive regulatory protein